MNSRKVSFSNVWERFGTFIIFIVMILIVSIIAPRQFMSTNNLVQIVVQSSTTMLISFGEFFAILIAGIDLSVGSVLALTSMVSAKLMVAGIPPVFAILIGSIIFGAFLGFVNGTLINFTGLHPFVITLGTNAIFRGLTLIVSNAIPVFGFPQSFKTAFGGMLWGWLPMPIFWAVLVALILKFITEKSIMGRNFYALGGSKESAWFSGINVKLHTLMVFMISGICAGMAGAVQLARIGSAEPMAGNGDETFAIASVIIGGASFFGGKGRISGVLVGALIIGLISNALNMLSVPTYYQQVVTGSLIIGAVTIDMFVSKGNK
ncbi:MAG: D-allose ABC transporter permease [Pleomorphochaeta sp.]